MRQDKPSNTALIVAAGMQLVRPEAATAAVLPFEAIRRGAAVLQAAHPRMASLLRQGWFRALCRTLERATLPGISLHFALRKRLLRNHARAAIAGGCRQVVVLGAGLDTLCMELKADHPRLCCIEIDHPATQANKRRAAGEGGQGIHFVGADLAQQALRTVLAACPAFDDTAPTLFVAEGLLMYVPLDAVGAMFAQMAAAASVSQVAFTWLEPQADGRPNFKRRSRLVDFWLKLRAEPFMSGMARTELKRFLGNAGFVLDAVNESLDLLGPAQQAELGNDALPLPGEYLCLAHTEMGKRRDQ
ncbi:MAG: SAM-dependent methyltransferase [Pseudomonadota bacterium]